MFGHNFYHGIIRKYIIMFGNMFNDIEIARYKSDGTIAQALKVPISYGPKEKYLARMRQDPNLANEFATVLPRLAFEVTNISYDSARSFNKMNKLVSIGRGNNSMQSQATPAPYDIDIALYGMFATQEDAVQVVEQILPFFRPEWSHTLKLVKDIDAKFDVPTILNDMSIEDTYESDFQTRRAIIYTFNFTVKGYMFGPVSSKGVIKRAKVTLSDPDSPRTLERVTTIPGLTVDKQPTIDVTKAIPIANVLATDNYGAAFDIDNFFEIISQTEEIGSSPPPAVVPLGPQRFGLTASPLVAEEGDNILGTDPDTVTFYLDAQNVPDRTKIYWTISDISDSDIQRSRNGYFVVLDQKAEVKVPVAKDNLTEVTEYMKMTLVDHPDVNVTVQINDTSFSQKFFLTSNTSAVYRSTGNIIRLSLDTSNVGEGEKIYLDTNFGRIGNTTVQGDIIFKGGSDGTTPNYFYVSNTGTAHMDIQFNANSVTDAKSRDVEFFLPNYNNNDQFANVIIRTTDSGIPSLSITASSSYFGNSSVSPTSIRPDGPESYLTLTTTNMTEGEPLDYAIVSYFSEFPASDIGLPATKGIMYAGNTVNKSIILTSNNQTDFLDRKFRLEFNKEYITTDPASNTYYIENNVGTVSQDFRLINLGGNLYLTGDLVLTENANNEFDVFGYDVQHSYTAAPATFNKDSVMPTLKGYRDWFLYFNITPGATPLYISEYNDANTENVISNTSIVNVQGATSGKVVFRPNASGTYYYFTGEPNSTIGTINVSGITTGITVTVSGT